MEKISKKRTKESHLYQGRLYSVKGEYKKAIEEYKKALGINPDYKPAKVNLSFITYMKGLLDKDRCDSNKHMKLQQDTQREI